MKNISKFFLIILLAIGSVLPLSAQEKDAEINTIYRRSSLYPVLLVTNPAFSDESDSTLNDMVMKSYEKAPFPDKYNDHRVFDASFKFSDYVDVKATDDAKKDAKKNGKKNNQRKIDLKYISAINKYMNEKKIAHKMVAKWFNRKENGMFDANLIAERGSYDASKMQVALASASIRGMADVQDAGYELINKTFFVVNKMKFVKNEPIAKAIEISAIAIAEKTIKNDLAQALAIKAAEIAYNASKDGYSVWTASYLYQLDWNEDIAYNFYDNMWMDESWTDSTDLSKEARKAAFDTTSIFKFKYLGFQKAKSLVLISAGKKTEEIIQVATIRNVDRVYTKLQKAYDVFKTKTPILSTDPVTASIGLKEGVESGDKFDVLEMVVDSKTGLTKYDKVGQVKANKKGLWDNRYNMKIEENPEDVEIKATMFKGGGKKIMSGMLLRQVK
ncbi:MAG: hypothetical protein IMY72_06620 [Bacteroidetes bacterium]|nr:hypothetical protein [Bacteroidota bacterium]